jgi:hypothetical protein
MIFLGDHSLEDIIIDDPEVSVMHEKHLEEGEEEFPFVVIDIADLFDFIDGEPLLRDREDGQKFLEPLRMEQCLREVLKDVMDQVLNILAISDCFNIDIIQVGFYLHSIDLVSLQQSHAGIRDKY